MAMLHYPALLEPHVGNDPTSIAYKTIASPLMLMRLVEKVGFEPTATCSQGTLSAVDLLLDIIST